MVAVDKEKELAELFEADKKAADAAALNRASLGGQEVDRRLNALNQFRRFPVNVLVSTQESPQVCTMREKLRKYLRWADYTMMAAATVESLVDILISKIS